MFPEHGIPSFPIHSSANEGEPDGVNARRERGELRCEKVERPILCGECSRAPALRQHISMRE
jgi:hypothetical protein